MGKAVEAAAKERGHNVKQIVDADNTHELTCEHLQNADVAIEFTGPESAYANYQKLFSCNIPVVTGTTGWSEHLEAVKEKCKAEGQTFFYAPNFNIGVNIFFEVSRRLAQLINRTEGYAPSVNEVHHIHKKDAPSGTAIHLANLLTETLQHKTGWNPPEDATKADIPVSSERKGEVPGTHTLTFNSDLDKITLQHEAKSRKGFAMGAVLAAEFILGKSGFFTMQDLLQL